MLKPGSFKILLGTIVLFFTLNLVWAYDIPEDNSGAKFFYVFGPQGDQISGAEDNKLVIYIDLPKDETESLTLAVYDPDTSGRRDWKKGSDNPWDTTTSFRVYGKKLLSEKEFSDSQYDSLAFNFGPYPKETGKKVGDSYRFRLEVEGIEGDDANLFRVGVSPESSKSFSYDLTFRLLPHEGDQMYFYPQVPAKTSKIIVENYDIDRFGGSSVLHDSDSNRRYKINDSSTGKWSKTRIVLAEVGYPRRLKYVITKAIQRNAHAGLRIKDSAGELLPIYFRGSAVPVVSAPEPIKLRPPKKKTKVLTQTCNEFIFDATSSYDPDNQSLSYNWDFGDGATSTKPIVAHTYQKSGEYKVVLTVNDNSNLHCSEAVDTQMVKVNTPPKVRFEAPGLACAGRDIRFDASLTTDETSENMSYHWDFGDGSEAQEKIVKKRYQKGGTYPVTLRVDDNENSDCSLAEITKSIKVNTRPIVQVPEDINLCLGSADDYRVSFKASGSWDPDGDKLDYTWDFGDGQKAKGEKVTHVYQLGGDYQVKLRVDDQSISACSSAAAQLKVSLNRAPRAIAGKNKVSCVGSPVIFDASASKIELGENLTYAWDFGDGQKAEGLRVEHAYLDGGEYQVTLSLDDGKSTPCSVSTDSLKVRVSSRPSAHIAKADDVCLGQKVIFDASASYDPDGNAIKYSWDFGDGTIKDGSFFESHTYQKGGQYKVGLKVKDVKGGPCSIDSDSIMVKVNTAPIANAGPNLVCCVGSKNLFDASASYDPDGDLLTYLWDFGDGKTARGAKVKHVYKKRGDYQITLTVDDNSQTPCSKSLVSFTANVNEKPKSIIKIR